MAGITRLDLPKPGKIKVFHIASDFHSEHYCKASYSLLLKHAKLLPRKERRLIIAGDFMDLAEFMERCKHFKKWITRTDCVEEYFLPSWKKEADWANERLDEMQKVFEEIVFMDGNHDWRIGNFRKQYVDKYWPAYSHQFDLIRILGLNERGITHVKYNDWVDLGSRLSILHGMYHGTTCWQKHYLAAKSRNVIFGHIHNDDVRSFISRDETAKAWSLPCMSLLNPEYLKNSENNWTNGFGVLRLKPNGKFNFHVNHVWDSELVLESGKILRA